MKIYILEAQTSGYEREYGILGVWQHKPSLEILCNKIFDSSIVDLSDEQIIGIVALKRDNEVRGLGGREYDSYDLRHMFIEDTDQFNGEANSDT